MAKTPTIFEDLSRFSEMGTLLERDPTPSLREVARKLGITHSAVNGCIQRLKERLGGVELVHTAEKSGASTSLTPEGIHLLQDIRRLVNWRPEEPKQLRVVLSHALLTSRLLSPAMAEFKDHHKVQIKLRTDTAGLDFERVIRELQMAQLDVAVVWDTELRDRELPRISSGRFKRKFDLVFVSRDSHDVTGIKANLQRLASKRLVTLYANDQPMNDRLPRPNHPAGGARVEVGTIDAILARVMAGVDDIGLVPDFYESLGSLSFTNQLFVSEPIGKASLMWFCREGMERHTIQFVKFVEDHLSGLPTSVQIQAGQDALFPSDSTAFYERFRFAYYLDHPRRKDDLGVLQPPLWYWEQVKLWRTDDEKDSESVFPGKPLSFRGWIRNALENEFRVEAQLVGPRLFYVQANYRAGPHPPASVKEFISVFNWCSRIDGKELMYGHWSGTDPRDNYPVVYSTIWSSRSLSIHQLRALISHVKIRTVLDIDEGYQFGEQDKRQEMTIPEDWLAPALTNSARRKKN